MISQNPKCNLFYVFLALTVYYLVALPSEFFFDSFNLFLWAASDWNSFLKLDFNFLELRSLPRIIWGLFYALNWLTPAFLLGLNLVLHFACIRVTLQIAQKTNLKHSKIICAILLLHPLTPFAIQYHIQTSIILGTLCFLLAYKFHLNSISCQKLACYSSLFLILSFFCKEHFIVGWGAIYLNHFIQSKNTFKEYFNNFIRSKHKYSFIVEAIFVTHILFFAKSLYLNNMEVPLTGADFDALPAISILAQTKYFFYNMVYLILPWFWPRSIDLAVSPLKFSDYLWIMPFLVIVFTLLHKKPKNFLLWIWPIIYFLPELTVHRNTEALVLYRLYPLLPFFALLIASLLNDLPEKKQHLKTNHVLISLILVALIIQFNQIRNLKTGVMAWQQAVQHNKNVRPVLALGTHFILLKKYDQAIIYLTEAIKINPKIELSYINLAQAYLLNKNDEEAFQILHKLLLINPNQQAGLKKALPLAIKQKNWLWIKNHLTFVSQNQPLPDEWQKYLIFAQKQLTH